MKKEIVNQDVRELALERMDRIWDRYDRMAVAFSGGKDSTIVLHLALEVAAARGALPLDVYFWDEEVLHPETVEYVARVAARPDVNMHWLCLPIEHRNACSKKVPYWHCWAEEDRAIWTRPMPDLECVKTVKDYPDFVRKAHDASITDLFPADGSRVGWMLGIRADESLRRYRSVTHRVEDNYISAVSYARWVDQIKPIYDWSTLDVWTAPHVFDWDHNRAYEVMSKAGISPSNQRVCAPFGEQPLENLWMYQLCWPQLWEKMLARVPGAATAGRYARTPLWGYGSVTKGEDETWEEVLSREIEKWEPKTRKAVAIRIRNEIDSHSRTMPGVPIPDKELVYDKSDFTSGVTWTLLVKIAKRGDTKGRIAACYRGREEDGSTDV